MDERYLLTEELPISYPPSQLVWRASLVGELLRLAILMGKIGGPLLGGSLALFQLCFFPPW